MTGFSVFSVVFVGLVVDLFSDKAGKKSELEDESICKAGVEFLGLPLVVQLSGVGPWIEKEGDKTGILELHTSLPELMSVLGVVATKREEREIS